MKALKEGNYSRFDEKDTERALRYAEKLTRKPDSSSDSDFTDLKKHFN